MTDGAQSRQRITPPDPGQFRFRQPVTVRYRDVDAVGHVHNSVHLVYFEMARTGYLETIGFKPDMALDIAIRYPFILAEITCRFIEPVFLEDRISVYLRTCKVGNKSFDFEYLTVRADGNVVAAGRSVQVFFDYRVRKSIPVPPEFRTLIAGYEGWQP